MAKEKLTAAEWELVKDAPLWVNAVLWAGDKKGMAGTGRREEAALEETLKEYRSTNPLIRDILADKSEPDEKLKKATKAEAEVALGRIASIVESKVGADDLDAVNEFLLLVGRNVAGAASENALGMGEKVSKHESAALKELEVLLRATDAQKKARRDNALKEQAATAAVAKQQADTQAKAEQARKEAAAKAEQARKDVEAKAKAEQAKKEADQKERLEKAREEAEARKKESEQKERLEKAREEAEARQKEAQAEREALKAREEAARAEAARVEAEANARAEAARVEAEKAAAAKQAAPRFTEFIAEHTVVAGDNLSFISQKYYGHQGNFRLIYEANKDVIGDNMSLIRPGQKLRIPKL
jgi:colicin import membrane protein